jgi:hypothetical protein
MIPPIVVKLMKVTTRMVQEIKNQTNGHVFFLITHAGGLKIRTSIAPDHQCVCKFLDSNDVEFYTFNPNPAQQVKYILRGFPPSMATEEIVARLKAEGVEVSHYRLNTTLWSTV